MLLLQRCERYAVAGEVLIPEAVDESILSKIEEAISAETFSEIHEAISLEKVEETCMESCLMFGKLKKDVYS